MSSWLGTLFGYGTESASTRKLNNDYNPSSSLSRSIPSQPQAPESSGTMPSKRNTSQSQSKTNHDKKSHEHHHRTRQPEPRKPREGGRVRLSIANRFSGSWLKEAKREDAGDAQEATREAELLQKLDDMERRNRRLRDAHDSEASHAAALQEQLSAAQKECRKVEDQAKSRASEFQSQLQKLNTQNASTRRAYEDMKSKAEHAQREVEQKGKNYSSLRSNHETLDASHKALQKKNELLEADYKRLKSRFDNQTGEVQQLKEKHGAQQLILDHRTKELQEAQAYLTSTRSASGADIIRLVESLNSEILQVAAAITDALPFEDSTPAGSPDALQGRTQKFLNWMIGSQVIDAIEHHPTKDDADIIVQSGLQFIMVGHCTELIEQWHVNREGSKFLKDIYESVRKNNPPSVAGRWRTMTAQLKYSRYEQVEIDARTRITDSVQALVHRWMEGVHKKTPTGVLKMIEMKVAKVVNMAAQIDKVKGLDVVSEDWEVFYQQPGSIFDGARMEDLFRSSQDATSTEDLPGVVLCSTGLGLRRRDEKLESENDGWQVMSKAQVLLDTAFAK
ncbi:hypothetical protein PQX77_012812 [Marasmius sp. AFHP31]|nr:hypothetical protein PQX77_012812 [Marasmius sp. AFHP31]